MNTGAILARTPNLSYRQLHFWITKGYVRPESRYKDASGVAMQFCGDEVRVVQTMARLVTAGLAPAAAHRVARGEPDLAPGISVWVIDAPVGVS